jgi:hypothetical protein
MIRDYYAEKDYYSEIFLTGEDEEEKKKAEKSYIDESEPEEEDEEKSSKSDDDDDSSDDDDFSESEEESERSEDDSDDDDDDEKGHNTDIDKSDDPENVVKEDEGTTKKAVPKLDVRYKIENYEKMIKEAGSESVLKKIIYSLEKDIKGLQKTSDEFSEDDSDDKNDNWKKNEEEQAKSFWPKTSNDCKIKNLMPDTDETGHIIPKSDNENKDEKSFKTFDYLPEYQALLVKAREKLKKLIS